MRHGLSVLNRIVKCERCTSFSTCLKRFSVSCHVTAHLLLYSSITAFQKGSMYAPHVIIEFTMHKDGFSDFQAGQSGWIYIQWRHSSQWRSVLHLGESETGDDKYAQHHYDYPWYYFFSFICAIVHDWITLFQRTEEWNIGATNDVYHGSIGLLHMCCPKSV